MARSISAQQFNPSSNVLVEGKPPRGFAVIVRRKTHKVDDNGKPVYQRQPFTTACLSDVVTHSQRQYMFLGAFNYEHAAQREKDPNNVTAPKHHIQLVVWNSKRGVWVEVSNTSKAYKALISDSVQNAFVSLMEARAARKAENKARKAENTAKKAPAKKAPASNTPAPAPVKKLSKHELLTEVLATVTAMNKAELEKVHALLEALNS